MLTKSTRKARATTWFLARAEGMFFGCPVAAAVQADADVAGFDATIRSPSASDDDLRADATRITRSTSRLVSEREEIGH